MVAVVDRSESQRLRLRENQSHVPTWGMLKYAKGKASIELLVVTDFGPVAQGAGLTNLRQYVSMCFFVLSGTLTVYVFLLFAESIRHPIISDLDSWFGDLNLWFL